jgi:hypothetical protein
VNREGGDNEMEHNGDSGETAHGVTQCGGSGYGGGEPERTYAAPGRDSTDKAGQRTVEPAISSL